MYCDALAHPEPISRAARAASPEESGRVLGWDATTGSHRRSRGMAGHAKPSVLDGVLDLRAGLLGVALDLVTAAFGSQAPAAGGPAGGFLDAALDCFGLVRDLPGDTHGGCLS